MQSTTFGAVQPLQPGARVALVAPSGVLRREDDLDRALENVSSFGWTPVVGAHIRSQLGYLAGSDEERLQDINSALASDEIDAIWCVRGGYGTMRLLASLNYEALSRRPKPVIGFSDITALHSAIHRQCGIITFHAPTARMKLSAFARASFRRAVVEQTDSCGHAPCAHALAAGCAKGRLIGGNLALITALLGTPYAPQFDGAILVLEDIGEAIYRIDRMLTQLILAGALQRCVAIVAGNFRPPHEEVTTGNRTLDEVLAQAATTARIPCLAGAPFGHISDQWTIPLGAVAELDTDARTLRVVGSDGRSA